MDEDVNILIIGPPNSGKKTALKYIKSANAEIKSSSYEIAILNNQKNYLFSIKSGEIYKSFEESILLFNNGKIVDGIIILIDNSKGFKEIDNDIVSKVVSKNIPHVIFSNKQDLSNKALNVNSKDSMIIPTIAKEGIGLQDGFRLLMKLIENNKQNLNDKNPKYEFQKDIRTKTAQNRNFDADKLKKLQSMMTKSDNDDICKLTISMHPIELDKLVKRLEDWGFSNLTVVETKFVDYKNASMETYRGSQYEISLKMKVEVIMILKNDDVPYVIKAIESIKSDDIDDNIIITPMEKVIRLRTEEEGEEALD